MARVLFTSQLARFVEAPTVEVAGATLADAMAAVFRDHPAVENYILDDQGAVRRHVQIFIDGEQVRDRSGLGDTISPDAEIYVFQALSGG